VECLIAVRRKAYVKKPWTDAERKVVRANLGSYFFLRRLPGKMEIVKCQQHPLLQHQSWQNIKDYIRNIT